MDSCESLAADECGALTVRPLGHHLLLELYECSAQSLDCVESVRSALLTAAQEAGATIVETTLHKFSPQGVSGVVIIAESHIAIHTWPEHQYVAIDCFSCGDRVLLERLQTRLQRSFQAASHSSKIVVRGLPAQKEPINN